MSLNNSTVKVIVISDVHLEYNKEGKRFFVLDILNDEVKKVRDDGFYPVVVCAGDIANGTDAYLMLGKIETEIIYVAGNHEFWGGDFYEINEELIKKSPPNVHYLYNNFVIIKDTIFAGSTLWTDVGLKTNPDISKHCTHSMRDVSKISAKKWYKYPKNLKKLKILYSFNEDLLDAAFLKNAWNIIIEREENEKTINFLNAFAACLELKDLYLKEDIISEMKDKFSFSLVRELALKGHEKLLISLWNKIKSFDTKDKKIIAVTHHLPFFEELSIGSYTKRSRQTKILPPLFNNVDKAWLNISSGEDYCYENYFFLCQKGEFVKNKSITSIFHYMNNGVRSLHPKVTQYFKNWIHGHEHNYAYIDFLKGFKIITNPVGSIGGIVFTDSGIEMKQSIQEIAKIKESFLTSTEIIKKTPHVLIRSWCWYLSKENLVLEEINIFENTYKSKISLLKKLWQKYNKNNKICKNTISLLKTNESIQDSALNKIEKFLNDLRESIDIRSDENFSYLKSLCSTNYRYDNYEKVLDKLYLNTSKGLHLDMLLDSSNTESMYFSVKDIIKIMLDDLNMINTTLMYIKCASEYYEDAFKDIKVYNLSDFESVFNKIIFNKSLREKIKKSQQIFLLTNESSIPLNQYLFDDVNNKKIKNLSDKFFELN